MEDSETTRNAPEQGLGTADVYEKAVQNCRQRKNWENPKAG